MLKHPTQTSEEMVIPFVNKMLKLNAKELDQLEIYLAFMNDKYWYPSDCTMDEAIEDGWYDTIAIISSNMQLLKTILKMGRKFDEADLSDFGKRKAVRLWMD